MLQMSRLRPEERTLLNQLTPKYELVTLKIQIYILKLYFLSTPW